MTGVTLKTLPARRQRLHRLYFRLMDIALVASLLVLLEAVLPIDVPVDEDGNVELWAGVLGYVLVFFSFLLTPVLVLARFMRDEYAERLFRRTTDILVYIAVTVPFVIFLAATIVFLVTRAPEAPYPFSLFMGEISIWSAMAQPYRYFCLLFVFIFQFLRWRDSR